MAEAQRRFTVEGFDEPGFDEIITQQVMTQIVPPPPRPQGPIFLLRVASSVNDQIDLFFSSNHPEALVGTQYYRPIISDIGYLETNLNDGGGSFGRRVIPQVGQVRLNLGSGQHDDLCAATWRSRKYEIARGERNTTRHLPGNYSTVMRGRTLNANWEPDALQIMLGDETERFKFIPQIATYAGTGGNEGGPDLKGKPKPRWWGLKRLITPVLVDPILNIYQVHFRRVGRITAVYENMLRRFPSGDISNLGLSSLQAWNPTPGVFITDQGRGMFRMGAQPTGRLAVDGVGEVPSIGVGDEGWPMGLLLRLRETYAPDTSVHTASILGLNNTNRFNTGIYQGPDDSRTLEDLFNELLAGVDGYWTLNSQGVFEVGLIGFTPPVATLTDNDFGRTLHRISETDPAWEVVVNYRRNDSVHNENEITPLAPENSALRTFALNEWRTAKANDPTILDDFPTAKSIIVDTEVDTEPHAQIVADRVFARRRIPRENYGCTLGKQAFQFKVGQTVHIESSRFLLTPLGKDMIIMRVQERMSEDLTDLELWG